MLNAIEDKPMVHSITDTSKMKSIDADTKSKSKQNENQLSEAETAALYDRFNLSSTSKQLEALKASLSDVPEINEARVMYFKAEIQSGNYQINSEKIAKNMMNVCEIA